MPRGCLLCAQLLALAFALGVFAVTATACEGGGGGGGELTSLSTKLSGGGKEGEAITVLEGTKAKDKATLTGKNASKANGKVTYKVYSENTCKTLVASAGEVTVSGENVPASSEEELEAGRTYYWQAHYGGDANNAESTSPCTEILTVQAKTSLSTKLSGESKEAEELTVLEGSKVKDKATLSGTNSSTATGKALYKVFSDKECKTLVKEAGEVTVTSGSIPASTELELTGGASYYWQVTYKGDGLHQESTSTCGKEISSIKARTSLSTKLSGESKEGEELTVLEGSKVKDKATLNGTQASTAGGKLVYRVYSDKECKTLIATAGEVTVTNGSVPASSEETLTAGATYYWQASYGGDSLHQASTSTCGKEIANIKATTALTTSLSGENKEGEALTVLEGAVIKDKAMLSGTNVSKATGKVTYKIYSDKECKTLVTEAGEVTVTSGSVPASSEEKLTSGLVYYWQASYSGDTLHQASTSACGNEISTVKATVSIATLLKYEEHSGEALEVSEELSVTDTATLSGTHSSSASGTVTYKVYSDKECKTLVATAGEVIVTSGSVPQSTEESLPAGIYYWQATYSGDSLHQASTSACGKEIDTVKAVAALATSLSGEGQTSSKIEVVEGASVTDQATLTGVNALKAGGTVKYNVYSDEKCTNLITGAGEVAVTNGSVPASTEEKLKAGTYYWQASYSGDAGNASSTTTCGEEVAVANAATSVATSLSGSGQEGGAISVPEGTKIIDHATLSGPNAGKASGNVEYAVYRDSECENRVTSAGEVPVTTGSVPPSNEEILPPGTYYWRAFYTGDGANHSSTSQCGKEVAVVKAVTSLATTLSGGGRSHEAISVLEGAAVVAHATLGGAYASNATGTVKYDVYSDKECKTLVTHAGEAAVTNGSVPASNEEKLKSGTYYWQATYSGDSMNQNSSSICGKEIAIVKTTLLTTSLSGEGKSGEEIGVVSGSIHDTATLSGEIALTASGTVKYGVYSDNECKTLVAEAGEVTVSSGLVPASREETLAAGNYYWQATYSGDSHHEGSTTPCGDEVAVVGPTPPKIEQVDFANNIPVIIDNQHNGEAEPEVAIEEYAGHDNVEWEYSPTKNELIKSWPVAYVNETTPELKARFQLLAPTKQLILEKRIEGKPVITGKTTLNGEVLSFTKEFASIEALETQVKKHEGYIEIGESGETPILANKTLHGRVGYEPMTIEWTWTIKVAGTASNVTQNLGSSKSELYVTSEKPAVAPCRTVAEAESVKFPEGKEEEGEEIQKISPCTPFYFSALYVASTSIEQVGPRTEAEKITDIWKGFSEKELLPLDQRRNNPPIKVPKRVRPWWPFFGQPGPPVQFQFKYYQPVEAGKTATALAKPAQSQWQNLAPCGTSPLLALLASGTGRCGAWSEWLLEAFLIEGVTANKVGLVVRPAVIGGVKKCDLVCTMLVKKWQFADGRGTSGNQEFPFKASEVTDLNGIAGQGVENPPPFFWDHVIVRAGTGKPPGAPMQLFDPSYGEGPFSGKAPGERVGAYQAGALDGFCKPAGQLNTDKVGAQPVQCAKLPAGGANWLAAL
jgi:uncharacterized protein YacL (UPF0231 family)